MIKLVPYGGLANRMKAIDSACLLAKDTSSQLNIVWYKDKGLNCRFDELFLPINTASIKLREATLKDYILYDRPRKKNFYIPELFQQVLFKRRIREHQSTLLMRENFNYKEWATGSCHIAACTYFYKSGEGIPFTMFRPIPKLVERINERTSSFNNHTYGIHIRRTDHILSIQESPTELFVEKMQAIIAEEPEANFYLASDSEEDKRFLKEHFPGKVLTHDKPVDRSSLEGMQEALVELYTLAKTRTIMGSSMSSFSKTAAQVGQIPFITVRKSEKILTIIFSTDNSSASIIKSIESIWCSTLSTDVWIMTTDPHISALDEVKRNYPKAFFVRYEDTNLEQTTRLALVMANEEDYDYLILAKAGTNIPPTYISNIVRKEGRKSAKKSGEPFVTIIESEE